MPTINQFRALIPGGDKMSDYDIVQEVSKTLGWDEKEVANKLRFGASNSGITGQQVSSSIDRYQAGLYGVAEEVAGAVGAKDTSGWLAKQRTENELRADIAAQKARKLGAVDTWEDVHSLSDFGSYAKSLGIQSAPYLGEAALGGIGTRLAMSGTRAALVAAEASGDVAAAARAKRALNIGSSTGGAAASYPSSVGDVLSEQRDQTGGTTNPAAAFALGIPYAALNAGGIEGTLSRGQLFRNPLNLLDNVSGLKGAAARTAATGTTSAFKEGVQETAQQAVNQVGRMSVDPTEQFFNEKSNERFKESFIGGATLGGLIGGGAGGWRRSESFVAGANTGTNDQTGQQSTNDIQQTFQQTSTGTTPTAIPANRFADQMAGSAGRVDPLAGRASLLGQTEPQTTAPITPAATTTTSAPPPAPPATTSRPAPPALPPLPLLDKPSDTEPSIQVTVQGRSPSMGGQLLGHLPISALTAPENIKRAMDVLGASSPEHLVQGVIPMLQRRGNILSETEVRQIIGTPTAPAVAGGTTAIAQQTQADFAAQQQQKQAERAVFMANVIGLPNPEGQRWSFFGKPIFGPAIQEAAAANAQLVGSMSGTQARITRAINIANDQTGGKLVSVNFNPLKAADSVRKTLEKVAEVAARFQIAHVGSVEEAAQILEQLSQSAKGAQLEQINAIHQALTGTDTTGYTASQQTKGATNEPKLQTTAGVGTVPVQGGTGEGSSGNAGDVQPSGVQSLLTGSQPQGQTGQQTGQPSGEGIRDGTSVTTDVSGGQPTPGQVNEQQTSGVGEGQTSNQPQQTATGTVGEQTVQNGPRTYSPTIGYYASDLAHISSERRIEIIRELFNKVLATTKGANAETRGEILRLALLEQFSQADIAELVGMSEAAVQKQLERMSIKMDREIGQYVVTDPTIALKIVDEAANFRSAEFPDGIGEGELAGLYATRSEYETNKSQTLAEELEQGEQEGDRSKLLAEEMQRGEGGEDRTMGTIGEAGGSQGAVDTEGQAFFAKMEKLKAELDALPPKDPRRAQLEKKIKDQWTEYGKQQATRGAAGEITVTPEGEEDAVQEQGTDEGDVRQPAEGGKAVGKGNAKPAKPARKAKQAKTEAPVETKVEEVKTPKEQWDELRTLAPELPAYDSLNKDQKIRFDDLANRGKANLAAVVNQIVTAPATEEVTEQRQTIEDLDASGEQPKFGKGTAPAKPYTAKSLIAELKAFMRVDALGRNVIVVDDVADLEDLRDQAIGWSNDRAFGWTRGGKAILIASRIQEGQGRAKFMHEVGSHLGLDRMLSEKDIVGLASQISKWADLNNNSKESVLARKAIERVGNANVADEDVMSELIAYFVEEAILSGVDPSASSKLTGAFGNWFRTLWAGFKNAVRKLGFKPESLTAQDVVNMAYGAARLEVAGTWHGTAAEFRKFNHQYMGTGEGAQAFGWGSYLAQRYGIAEGYRTADIKRKTKAPLNALAYSYGGLNDFQQQQQYFSDGGTPIKLNLTMLHSLRVRSGALYIPTIEVTGSKTPGALSYKAADQIFKKDGSPLFSDQQIAQMLSYVNRTSNNPVGSMMRVDVNMQDNETLNWDEKISNMPQEVQDNLAKIKDSLEAEGLLEGYLDKLNADWEELTGADLYKTILKQAHEADAKIFHDIPGSDRMKADKASSLLLDSLGIKGLKFLDARSRDKGEKQIMFNGKTYSREDLINMKSAKGTPIPLDQITTLRHVLRHGVEETIKEYQAKVDKREKQILNVYRESAERYKVPFNEAEELARAKQQALNSYEAKQIEFLKAANVKIVDNKDVTRNLVVFNDANIFRAATNIGGSKEQVKFGISPAAAVDETINRLPPFVRTPTRNLVTGLLHQAKNGIYASAITEDVVKMASKYMKSAKDYLDAQYARQATRIEFEQRINKILSDYDKLSGEFKGTGANSVNKFIKDSTVSGKWGYYPGENRVGTELFTVDPDMKLRFDAFDESAQNVIKAVFEHGYDALMLKKKAVEAAIDREFADREKAAMGDTEQLQELAKEKKLLLAREAKIRGIDISSPYAYLGRYGDYVVVAKSAEFKHYEERAKLNDWDVKQAKQWLQDNISNSDHYVVQFAETQAEADTIAEQLHATGNYDIMPEDAGVKEAEESYTGGGDIHLAVGRLRNLLQRQVSDGDMSSANFQSMNKMVGDLYLMTVAESSARKSLLQRKNVAGADDNMMRNLATSGRADAHFLSTLEHNDAITDSMERMRAEAKNQRREAMPLYNELAKRQANSMEYKTPSTLAIALNRMNTIWSLTFSPAYYMQQVLQTAVISVPYLAGRLGYGTAVTQVNRGYKDMAGLVKGLGVNDHIDFSKAPADVRDMLNKLVGMGKIDISMDADERATADEKGILAKVMYKMQGVNNRIEAVNRSVAAIAAYRGYLARYGNNNTEAATQYAAQVVSDTHGSYDGFNTPRALAGNIGRVVGQFRRFQIIQLSMLARLMNNAFKGTSADEKMVARKALGFITAQMAVVGGAMAVPFFNQIAWMMSKILGDPDEPDDFEFKLRRLIDNKVASDLLLRGVPAALGVDVSDKLGMGRVASILPFAQGDLTSRSGAEKILVAAMGPSANMTMKFADAFGMVLKGDYYKGLEMALPNGFANVMKAGRFASEGITMRNGDLVLKPEDFSIVDAAFQAVGLPTNTVTNRQFTQNVKAEYDKFYAQRSADIKSSYVKAYRDNDSKGMADAREEFQRMEDSRVANGYKRQPMSDLFKAPMEAMKRERGVIGGVETSKQNRRFVELAGQI